MPSPVDTIEVQNVVASTGIGQELDLNALEQDLDNVSYDPDSYPGLIWRLTEPKASALIFRTGKIVCTGAKSVGDVHDAIHVVSNSLRDLGIQRREDHDIIVQNIVSCADIGSKLNLNTLTIGLGLENVEYEPEQFPGLVYRMNSPEVVVLLFGSGKLVITGGKTTDDAVEAVDGVRAQLTELGILD